MYKLTPNQLLLLNRKITDMEAQTISPNRFELLKEISETPYRQNKEDSFIYKGPAEKAAKLGNEIALKKPFERSNRDTAVLALLTLLELNGVKLKDYRDDLGELYDNIEDQALEKTYKWICSHIDESR